MTPRRSIAVLTLARGEGDLRAAEVIQRAIQDGEGNFETRIVDALPLSRGWFQRTFSTRITRGLEWAARRILKLFGCSRRSETLALPEGYWRRGCREVLRRWREAPPDMVIAMGSDAANLASLAKRDGLLVCPVLVVQTRLEIEPPAAHREIDVFSVASEDARAELIARGVSPNRIVVCGFPVDPAFSLPFDVEDLMPALGLDPRRPVVLVMACHDGARDAAGILGELERCTLPVQAVVVAGRDPAVKGHLESLRGKLALDFQIFGWTDMVPELMAVADLLVTKPTALPTAEALTLGLPMVLTPAGSPAEERLSRDLEHAGAAVRSRSLEELSRLCDRLFTKDVEDLSRMGKRARELGRPAGAHAVAQIAHALLETSSYIDFLAVPPARPGESAYLM